MPPSQLKRLKASLREQGITGAQKSKKQKKNGQSANVSERVQRQAALQGIRDSFNPFEIKAPSRPAKFQTTTRSAESKHVGRPGVTKSMGEEARRATLLPEMQRRNKSGGIVDRRIGENDPSMTPEERALHRFAREKQRKKGATLFDLEDVEEEDFLTHGGQALNLEKDPRMKDDFDMDGLADDASDEDGERPLKRRRPSEEPEDDEEVQEDGDEDKPARKKSKAEVMKEVIAKSKLHKYERQKAKEDDDDLREELDKGMQDMLAELMGHKPANREPQPKAPETNSAGMMMNPDRLAMMKTKEETDKEYDLRLRQMAMDKRAAPTERTKTAEEKAAEEAQRLKDMEESRVRRMRGEEVEEEEDKRRSGKGKIQEDDEDMENADEDFRDDAAEFGLTAAQREDKQLVLDDEDEFALDEDLVASGSDVDLSASESDSGSDSDSDDDNVPRDAQEDEEDEFVRGILDRDTSKPKAAAEPSASIAYTYPCPRTHAELLDVLKGVPVTEAPTVVQRIRALYHPSLSSENKEKLADFSAALVDHISYMAIEKQPLAIIETLIRHIHSLTRTFPEGIATVFRRHLAAFHERGTPSAGDLIILTAISAIYPTSDHFHQVVTPAITLMARWLEMTTPTTGPTLSTGAFIVALVVKYQTLSKRYVPEAVRFTVKALQVHPQPSAADLQPHIDNLLAMADLWREKPSFIEIFTPSALSALQSLKPSSAQKKAIQHLNILTQQSHLHRRPLELHHHRPQPIRTSVPKFEESFNPDKHYDPDKERAEAAKLRAEYKRERKGALRELRKDANFVAREQLREKKERDAEYEKKYRRLVAEIQGEEGHAAKEYEREKRMRKGGR